MIVSNSKQAERMMKTLKAERVPIVDLETKGLNHHMHRGDFIGGMAIMASKKTFYVPFRHGEGKNMPIRLEDDIQKELSRKKRIDNHNTKFDLHGLDKTSIPDKVDDTMSSAHLLDENEESFALKKLAVKYLGEKQDEEQSKLKQKLWDRELGNGEMWKLPVKDVAPYAEQDVRLVHSLRELHRQPLEEWGLTSLYEEMAIYNSILTKIERRGMLLNGQVLEQLLDQAEIEEQKAELRIQTMAGYPANPRSPKQMQAWLGVPSTAAEILETGQFKDDVRAQALLNYRGWQKSRSSYLSKLHFAYQVTDGKFHPNLRPTGTYTGRLSSSRLSKDYGLNAQSFPRKSDTYKVKEAFIAREGMAFVEADYSMAEMRLSSHYAKEMNMANLLIRGLDIHQITADEVGCTRPDAKRINFSVVYRIGAKTLAKNLNISEEKAYEYLEKYHATYPGFRRLANAAERRALDQGYIRFFTGRVRHYNRGGYKTPEYKASSNLIQGGVGEMTRIAMMRCEEIPHCHMLLQVHDSIVFEVEIEHLDETLREIKHAMEDFPFNPPPKVDFKVGTGWGTAKPYLIEEVN